MTPSNQSILDELHAIREQLLAEAGGTLAGLVARIREDQKASGREIWKPRAENHSSHQPPSSDLSLEAAAPATGDN